RWAFLIALTSTGGFHRPISMPRPCAVVRCARVYYRGAPFFLLLMPRPCAVVAHADCERRSLETNVRHHGTRPWHREAERAHVETNVRHHGTRPWPPQKRYFKRAQRGPRWRVASTLTRRASEDLAGASG